MAEQLYTYYYTSQAPNAGTEAGKGTTFSSIYGNLKKGQSFTPSANHALTKIRLRLGIHGTLPSSSELTVELYEAGADKLPTGAVRSSGTLSALSVIADSSEGEWIDIVMSSYDLVAGTRYAFYAYLSDSDSSNYLAMRIDGNGYGQFPTEVTTEDEIRFQYVGSTSTPYTTADILFEEYGEGSSELTVTADVDAFILKENTVDASANAIIETISEALFTYYNSTNGGVDDERTNVYGSRRKGNSFTPDASHRFTRLRLKLGKYGTLSNVDLLVEITSVDLISGLPTGPVLSSGTINSDTITAGTSGAWYDIQMSSCDFTAGVQYAFYVYAPTGTTSSNYFLLRYDTTGTYAGGERLSYDSTAGWSIITPAADALFEEYGEDAGGGLTTKYVTATADAVIETEVAPPVGDVFYLDPQNGSDSNAGTTSGAPWKTLVKAQVSATDGSTVYLKAGTYGDFIFNSTAKQRTSWTQAVTYQPAIGVDAADILIYSLRFSNAGSVYIYIDGLTMDLATPNSTYDQCLYISGTNSHISIQNGSMLGVWKDRYNDGITLYGVRIDGTYSDITINNCEIKDLLRGVDVSGNPGSGIIISNNEIHRLAGGGVSLSTAGNVVTNSEIIVDGNNIYDCVSIEDSGGAGTNTHASGISIRTMNTTVRNNIIHGGFNTRGIRCYQDIFPTTGYQNMLFENNLVYDTTNDLPVEFVDVGSNFVFRNNTIIGHYSQTSNTTNRYLNSVTFLAASAVDGTGFSIHNNILIGIVSIDSALTEYTEDNNIIWSAKSTSSSSYLSSLKGASTLIITTGAASDFFEGSGNFFAGGSLFDQYSYTSTRTGSGSTLQNIPHRQDLNELYRLAPGSIGIGFANPSYLPTDNKDIDGNNRGSDPDAGCYEFDPITQGASYTATASANGFVLKENAINASANAIIIQTPTGVISNVVIGTMDAFLVAETVEESPIELEPEPTLFTPSLDLTPMIPEKFRSSTQLQSFLNVMTTAKNAELVTDFLTYNILTGNWSSSLKDVPKRKTLLLYTVLQNGASLLIAEGDALNNIVSSTASYLCKGSININQVVVAITPQTDIVSIYATYYRTEISVEEITGKIDGMLALLDPWRTQTAYLQNLADLLGTILASTDTATEAQRRKELLQTVDWYKMKGTNLSIQVIGLILGLSFKIYDKYATSTWIPTVVENTDTGEFSETGTAYNSAIHNYSEFIDVLWFVGNEGQNPIGVPAGYFKSPHFGLSFQLTKVYLAGTYTDATLFPDSATSSGSLPNHLWRPALFTGLSDYVEKTRPVNAVPHYQLELYGETKEGGSLQTIANSEVTTQIVGDWSYNRIYFDGASAGSSGEQIYFDEDADSNEIADRFFDTNIENFINSLTKWKLGNSGSDLTGSDTDYIINSVVLSSEDEPATGTVLTKKIYQNRIEFRFAVNIDVIQDEINELGIYTELDQLMVMATFPNIYKGTGTTLNFLITVYRS